MPAYYISRHYTPERKLEYATHSVMRPSKIKTLGTYHVSETVFFAKHVGIMLDFLSIVNDLNWRSFALTHVTPFQDRPGDKLTRPQSLGTIYANPTTRPHLGIVVNFLPRSSRC